MCYLCQNSSPFSSVNRASSISRKRDRMLEIKRVLKEAEDKGACPFGDTVVEALKREQYRLSQEL